MRVMIEKIMKTKNCHVQKELVKVGEHKRFMKLILASRYKVVHIKRSEYVIFQVEQVGAIGGQLRYGLNDELLAAAAPKHYRLRKDRVSTSFNL